jgi:hypothetical protein
MDQLSGMNAQIEYVTQAALTTNFISWHPQNTDYTVSALSSRGDIGTGGGTINGILFSFATISGSAEAFGVTGLNVRFSNRPFEVKRFQTIHHCSVDVARGSCFSSESAPRPFHHGIRRRGGTIFATALPSV